MTADIKEVFISYGRKESKYFAQRLYNSLAEKGVSAWFDNVNIPKGDDFQQRIDHGIERADNFVFIIAPHANSSEYCLREIAWAIACHKRIIPVLHIEEAAEKVHPNIARINWVYARQKVSSYDHLEAWEDQDDFDKAVEDILQVIRSHQDYVRQHTKLLAKALEWQRNQLSSEELLVGQERKAAEIWLKTEFKAPNQPPCTPTDLMCDFLCESKKNAENLMTDAFISFAAENKEDHYKIQQALSRYLITCWTHQRDIKKGENFETAIHDGIEKANSVLFLISRKSLASAYCMTELRYAISLNKKIIPLLIEAIPEGEFPEEIKRLQYINLSDNMLEEDLFADIGELVRELELDKSYYEQHKIFLVQALKWKRQHQNTSILLRGYNLQNAIAFLQTGERKAHPPTVLHGEFIEESRAKAGQLNTEVFISYSRNDSDFVRKLNDELQLSGKTTWFDQESIASGAQNFQEEIYRGIEISDNFLFVISPKAIASEYCQGEVAHAVKMGKRIITVLHAPADQPLPEGLTHVNWIDFEKVDFHRAFTELLRTLDTDRVYVQQHTHWGIKAQEWMEKGKLTDLLLRGSECTVAEEWLKMAQKQGKKPKPTPLHALFIEESAKELLADQARKANTIKKLRVYLVLSVIGLIASLAFGGWAIKSRHDEQHAKELADSLRVLAEEQAEIARLNEITAKEKEIELQLLTEKYAQLLALSQEKGPASLVNDQEAKQLVMQIETLQKEIDKDNLNIKDAVRQNPTNRAVQEQVAIPPSQQKILTPAVPSPTEQRTRVQQQMQIEQQPSVDLSPAPESGLGTDDAVGTRSAQEARPAPATQDGAAGSERTASLQRKVEYMKEEAKRVINGESEGYIVTAVKGEVKFNNGERVIRGAIFTSSAQLQFIDPNGLVSVMNHKGRFIITKDGILESRPGK